MPAQVPAAAEIKKKSPLLPSKQEAKGSIFSSAPLASKAYQDKVSKISKTSLTKETVYKEAKEEKTETKMGSSITSALKSRVNKGV